MALRTLPAWTFTPSLFRCQPTDIEHGLTWRLGGPARRLWKAQHQLFAASLLALGIAACVTGVTQKSEAGELVIGQYGLYFGLLGLAMLLSLGGWQLLAARANGDAKGAGGESVR